MKFIVCKEFPCFAKAVWYYAPSHDGDDYYCDKHVPRGCSCNIDPDTNIEDTDDQGRLLPCCEFDYEANGFESLPDEFDSEYYDD